MIRSSHITMSLDSHREDFRNSIIKGYKYIRVVKQFNSKESVCSLLKNIKKAKTVQKFKLQTNYSSSLQAKLRMVQSALKLKCQTLNELDITEFIYSSQNMSKNLLFPMKKLNKIYITDDLLHFKNLVVLKKLESLFIEVINNQEENYPMVYRTLTKLLNLKSLCLLVLEGSLSKPFEVLNKYSAGLKKRLVEFEILVKGEYDNEFAELPGLSENMLQKVSKINMQHLDSEILVSNLFKRQTFCLSRLQVLTLRFNVPDLGVVHYLQYLRRMIFLDKLSISFLECWDDEFIEGIFRCLQLPIMLEELKINMPISFEHIFQNFDKEEKSISNFPWRKDNFFEQEPYFFSFFQNLKLTRCLRKVEFTFLMTESFDSYYTNFFVSILNQLPKLSSFLFRVTPYILQGNHFNNQGHQCFDLPLLFKACSALENLEHMQVFMPNLLFEGAEINDQMTNLKSFAIGITEKKKERVLKFDNISGSVTRWLKGLLKLAPNLNNLVLDFTEEMNETAFCRRFMLIERFKLLETFCSKFVINKCSVHSANTVGKSIQSLEKLNKIVLRFFESDENILEMRKYLNYKKSLREVFFSFGQICWVGKTDEMESDQYLIEEGEFDNLDNLELMKL